MFLGLQVNKHNSMKWSKNLNRPMENFGDVAIRSTLQKRE